MKVSLLGVGRVRLGLRDNSEPTEREYKRTGLALVSVQQVK